MADGDTVSTVPLSRWDVAQAAASAHELQAGFGAFLSDVAGFDASLFGLPEAEARLLDPQQRLLLEVACEVTMPLHTAASVHARLPLAFTAAMRASCGVYMGLSSRDYFTLGKEYGQV